jgi:hypothetical protein
VAAPSCSTGPGWLAQFGLPAAEAFETMMRIRGLHVLLTHQCTRECDHCFVWGSPSRRSTLTLASLRVVRIGLVDLAFPRRRLSSVALGWIHSTRMALVEAQAEAEDALRRSAAPDAQAQPREAAKSRFSANERQPFQRVHRLEVPWRCPDRR